MNLSEIRDLVIEHTNRSDKATLIDSMINAALRKVSSEHTWRDLLEEADVTLIANQSFIALASNVKRLAQVSIIDGLSSYPLLVRPKKWIIDRWPDLDSQSPNRPCYGYLEGRTLYLMPPPNEAFTLRYSYYRRHDSLSSDTDELEFDHIDEAVIAYATYRTFKSLQQHEDAALWFADYKEVLKDAKKMDHSPAVTRIADQRGRGEPVRSNYWLDPFQKEVP